MKNELEKKIEFVRDKVYQECELDILGEINKQVGNFLNDEEKRIFIRNYDFLNLERLLIALNKINKHYAYLNGDIMLITPSAFRDYLFGIKLVCKYDLKNEQNISKLAEIFGYSEN